MKKILISSLALLGLGAVSASAQLTISTAGQSYSQNFDSLESTDGQSATFVDNSTILGWYANSEEMDTNFDEYFGSDGSETGGEVYSYGSNSDRAFGYVGSGGNDFTNFAVRIVNGTGSEISDFSLSYTGEQWRSGGNTSDNNNLIRVSYQIVAAGNGDLPTSTDLTGWTEIGSLLFSAPNPDIASGALDGNASGNRTVFGSTSIADAAWASGSELWIRFTGNDGSGTDAGLAIDDFSFVGGSAVPEPSTYALLAGLGMIGFVAYRRRKAAAVA